MILIIVYNWSELFFSTKIVNGHKKIVPPQCGSVIGRGRADMLAISHYMLHRLRAYVSNPPVLLLLTFDGESDYGHVVHQVKADVELWVGTVIHGGQQVVGRYSLLKKLIHQVEV